MLIQLRNYEFEVNPGQNKRHWDYINSGYWEPHSLDIFDYFINKNSIVLDIGSWSGVLSLYAANKAKEVHALDPDPVCFKELKKNLELNPSISKNIKIYNTAISDKKERLQLSAREKYGQSSSSILKRKRDTENSLEIETIPLLEFLQVSGINQVNFIKMDVEGAEFKILPALGKALKKLKYPVLFVSFHYGYLNEHFYQKYIPFNILNKALIKLKNTLKFSLFGNKIQKQISSLFDDLEAYKYLYKNDGTLISFSDLKQHLDIIKDYDLVFSNSEWHKQFQ